MTKSTRLFEIIQILRAAKRPILGQEMADMLEVSVRTIYRDIVSLQAMQVPIDGAAGVGYVMRKGYNLPPINFDVDEAEAIAMGLQMIARTGDPGLWRAAGRAARKLHEAAPSTRQLVASSWGTEPTDVVDLAQIRSAIRDEVKINIAYCDAAGQMSERTIWPLVLIYYADNTMIVAWCELRQDLRHFRVDRIADYALLQDDFKGAGAALITEWEETQKERTVTTQAL